MSNSIINNHFNTICVCCTLIILPLMYYIFQCVKLSKVYAFKKYELLELDKLEDKKYGYQIALKEKIICDKEHVNDVINPVQKAHIDALKYMIEKSALDCDKYKDALLIYINENLK